ncbi:MAG: hypothetical protein LBB76_08610 [Azoarcus sp.]|jgi:hypothetical protein|nr:hypothetical protein [Azoarcus sp.]
MNKLKKFIPYPFGELFFNGEGTKKLIYYHRILAIFLYGQLLYYRDGWLQVLSVEEIKYDSRAPYAFFVIVTFFFYSIGTVSKEKIKLNGIKSVIAEGVGLPICIFYMSFSFYSMCGFILISDWFLDPFIMLGLFNFFICLFSYIYVIILNNRSVK